MIDERVRSKLNRLIDEAIKAEGAFFEHYDKYDKEGRKLFEARDKARKELDEFVDIL